MFQDQRKLLLSSWTAIPMWKSNKNFITLKKSYQILQESNKTTLFVRIFQNLEITLQIKLLSHKNSRLQDLKLTGTCKNLAFHMKHLIRSCMNLSKIQKNLRRT